MDNYSPDKTRVAKEDWDKRHRQGWGVKDGIEKQPEPEVLEFFGQHKNDMITVVDIACGNGRHVVPLAQMGFQMTGVDFSSVGLEKTKAKLEAENLSAVLKQGDFHNLPFPDATFDGAVSTNAMNRNDWAGAKITFKEAARIIKPGGFFYLKVSSSSSPIERDGRKATIIEEPLDSELSVENRGITFSKVESDHTEPLMHKYTGEELLALGNYAGLDVIGEPKDEGGSWHIIYRKK
ncbi:MAG: class I SAM-dependent methyltransferase [Candidatus Paceibacterota bacterium]